MDHSSSRNPALTDLWHVCLHCRKGILLRAGYARPYSHNAGMCETQPSTPSSGRPRNFWPAPFFKSLTCILLSLSFSLRLAMFSLHSPPLSPCGFCHLFTDEWSLHRHDLNVSLPSHYGSLPLFIPSSSCSLPVSLPVPLDISEIVTPVSHPPTPTPFTIVLRHTNASHPFLLSLF